MGTPPIATITTLYNTGTDNNWDPLSTLAFTSDPHYVTGYGVRNPAVQPMSGGAPETTWAANQAGAQWITDSFDGDSAPELDITLNFFVPLDRRLNSLQGLIWMDNTVDVFVNGSDVPQFTGGGFTGPGTQFTLGNFRYGNNSILFKVTNSGGPGGLMVSWTSADVTIYPPPPPPPPPPSPRGPAPGKNPSRCP